MNTIELREKYNDNKELLKKYYKMLELSKKQGTDTSLVESFINNIKEEQITISKRIRRKMYKHVDGKDKKLLMKVNKSDSKTDKLPIKEVQEVILKDANIVFDGEYKLIFNDGKDCYRQEVREGLLNDDTASVYDFNIIYLLKEFDKEHKTKLYEKYMKNEIPVTYNFKNTNNKTYIKRIKKIAKRQKKEFNNYTINSTNKLKKSLIYAGLLVGGISGFLFANKNNKNNNDNKQPESISVVNIHEEKTLNNDFDKLNTKLENEGYLTTSSENAFTKEAQKTNLEELVSKLDEENLNVSKNVINDVKNTYSSSVIEDDVQSNNEIKIGDTITIDKNVDLYYSSTDDIPRGNTSYLNYNNYRVGLISLVKDNRVLTVLSNENETLYLDSLKDEDIKVSINLDLLDDNGNIVTKYVGWINQDDLKQSKVLVLK